MSKELLVCDQKLEIVNIFSSLKKLIQMAYNKWSQDLLNKNQEHIASTKHTLDWLSILTAFDYNSDPS